MNINKKLIKIISIILLLISTTSLFLFSCNKKSINKKEELEKELKSYNNNIASLIYSNINTDYLGKEETNNYSYKLDINENTTLYLVKQKFSHDELNKILYKETENDKKEINNEYKKLIEKIDTILKQLNNKYSSFIEEKFAKEILEKKPFNFYFTAVIVEKLDNAKLNIRINQLLRKNNSNVINIYGIEEVNTDSVNLDDDNISVLIDYIIQNGKEENYEKISKSKEEIYFFNLFNFLISIYQNYFFNIYSSNDDFIKEILTNKEVEKFIDKKDYLNDDTQLKNFIEQFKGNIKLDFENILINEKSFSFDVIIYTNYKDKNLKIFYKTVTYSLNDDEREKSIQIKQIFYFDNYDKIIKNKENNIKNTTIFKLSKISIITF